MNWRTEIQRDGKTWGLSLSSRISGPRLELIYYSDESSPKTQWHQGQPNPPEVPSAIKVLVLDAMMREINVTSQPFSYWRRE